MADQDRAPTNPAREAYRGDARALDAALAATRTVAREAAFLLAHLRPGMRLLDVGCGPGSITLGLAAAVAPGEVVGIDLRPEPLEQARAAAARRGIANARFEQGSAYELAFPDGVAWQSSRVRVREARSEDAPAMARVFVDSFRAGHRGQIPDRLLESRTYEASERGWARELAGTVEPPACILVAECDGGGLVGVAMGGPPSPWDTDETA